MQSSKKPFALIATLLAIAITCTLAVRGSYQQFKSDGLLDKSHNIFSPKSLGNRAAALSEFPALWWNFLIFENVKSDELSSVTEQCKKIASEKKQFISKLICGGDLGSFFSVIESWSFDFPRRHEFVSVANVQSRMNKTMAQASLPIGSLVNVLRIDPFQSLPELQEIFKSQFSSKLENRQGILFDESTHRALIPVQLNYPPSEAKRTAEFIKGIDVLVVGPHASAAENELQVRDDLDSVSLVGTLVVLFCLGLILLTHRWRLFLIIPPISVAMGLAALVTIGVFGSIHGLTLAFGPAIIGLAIDYGLHVGFSHHPKEIWKANFFGLLTTMSVLLVMMFSEIPLLRQLMFFSVVGLVFGFAALYFLDQKFPNLYKAKPFIIRTPRSPKVVWLVSFLSVIAVIGTFTTNLNLDMRQLNFETAKRSKIARWLYESGGMQVPLMEITDAEKAFSDKEWATANKINLTNIATYIPNDKLQKRNLATWKAFFCPQLSSSVTGQQKDFFSPFFKGRGCESLNADLLSLDHPPAYISDLKGKSGWLTLWRPANDAQAEIVKSKFPNAFSFVDIAKFFPRVFAAELEWMIPLALLVSVLLLFYYYRSVGKTAISLIPFFSGLGLYFLCSLIFGFSLSFISVVGLIMVFGFSIDYGIFATDVVQREEVNHKDVWAALTVASISNLAGFSPLIFCKHPVLVHLGQTLVTGTFGTYIGAVWGIPGFSSLLQNKNSKFFKVAKSFAVLFLILINLVVLVYHVGVFPAPNEKAFEPSGKAFSQWIDKEKFGINQLVVGGTSFERGKQAGERTKHLLLKQEDDLVSILEDLIPNRFILRSLVVSGILWFKGIENYYERWATDEMYGVSLSAPKQYDYLIDGYTRQIAYHGIHEVGQMMVDQQGDNFGCTAVAIPFKNSWVVGRNFDFEASRVFDEEKIAKWVFPTEGHAYLSVIWAGMVGAVTGVNENGLYLTINAAGSEDFKRIGTPSTLIITKVLQFAENVDQALTIIKDSQMFITDIFMLFDSKSGRAFRIEKSPARTEVLELKSSIVIANHLNSESFASDKTNIFRRDELTSEYREERGMQLVKAFDSSHASSSQDTVQQVLTVLRDKGEGNGEPLSLGNRRAIDSLIATHSIIYDGERNIFYISRGPGVSGSFVGFDLKKSFAERSPVVVSELPADPLVTRDLFYKIRSAEKTSIDVSKLVKKQKCSEAADKLQTVDSSVKFGSLYYTAVGDVFSCKGDSLNAREAWLHALEERPAYHKDELKLREKVGL